IALIGIGKLEGARLKSAKDGLIFVWLLEPAGAPFPPGLGGIRVLFDGSPYNAVTNPTSSKPLAPDLIVHDGARYAREHPELFEKREDPSPRSMVLEFLVRGDRSVPAGPGTVGLELGFWPDGTDAGVGQPRWTWFDFPFRP